MGYGGRVDAVDLALGPAALFRELCADWAGDVRLQEADAAAWLEGRRQPYDVILEDLTVLSNPVPAARARARRRAAAGSGSSAAAGL
jgi:spermidine synthase